MSKLMNASENFGSQFGSSSVQSKTTNEPTGMFNMASGADKVEYASPDTMYSLPGITR